MREISDVLARFIVTYINETRITLPERALLVPIPLHRKRLRERGFNQAEVIAKSLAKALSIPLENNILMRAKYAPPQTTMKTRKEREENAKNLYAVAAPIPDGATIILVDDVSTTGATLEEAARVLKEARAKQVWAFTAAR
ncbi:MAG: ComF family protein [Candidatus Sungbacteria bacterium]|nr:ComF family protein [Candidatus Sungbacteria bacterium]